MSQKMVTITKKEAAACQLETSIKLFLEHRDLISSYTLCCAADGILEGIYKNKRNEILGKQVDQSRDLDSMRFSWSEELEMRIRPEYKNEAFQALNAAQNFFKHADRDHDNSYHFADWNLTSIRLVMAIMNYSLVFQEITPAMSLYIALYATLNPDLLAEGNPLLDLMVEMPNIRSISKVLSHEEVAAIGYSALKLKCPELFEQ